MTTISAPSPEHGALVRRRLPIGAELVEGRGVHFRVWAPAHRSVHLVIEADRRDPAARAMELEMTAEEGGYFSREIANALDGMLYRYRLGDDERALPDPASRFQPDGPHGPSAVVDPRAFRWTDDQWRGATLEGKVIYELHVGTFTDEGTWAAAARELPRLAELGITVVEVMPVAEFCGRFGWGYDGVDLFAPTHLYGTPDDMRRFVDAAHAVGIGVVLDVVFNHLGPDGNYLPVFAPHYFTRRYKTDWGDALNFDGDGSAAVREFIVANAGYWVDEFHLDGLRLDATQDIHDGSEPHILVEIGKRVRDCAHGRSTLVIAENEPQHVRLVQPVDRGGFGLDALWNDDFHHSAMVAMTGRGEAYYSGYTGRPQELISAVKYGYLFQGQWYDWQAQRRGTPALGVPPQTFVAYMQNHDQVANSAHGARCHALTSPGRYRAMTALLLLAPWTPMLFQGQEFAASAPFLYFADHRPELARRVREGRAKFLRQFPSLATTAIQEQLADPADPRTFESSKLDPRERERHAWAHALHRDLLRLRRNDPVFALQRPGTVDGAVLASEALVLRFFGGDRGERLLILNLGRDLHLPSVAEPLLAPPQNSRWHTLWSSEDPTYGGSGALPPEQDDGWHVVGHSAVVLSPRKRALRARAT